MKKAIGIGLLVWLICLACSEAFALQKPLIFAPQEGAALGPSYELVGRMPYRAFLVVLTDVLTADGQFLGTVPGLRHWTNDDGSFRFRCASPRVAFGEKHTELRYRIRVFELAGNAKGPEAIINCRMAH